MKPFTSIILVNNQTNLNIRIYSEEKSETIILLHGGPGIPDPMTKVVNVFKDFFRVITFDQRGTGLSKCSNCTYKMEEYISDINAICEYLNIKRFHLFGHSWGGLYAQIYAQENPEKIKSLFLCSPSSGTNKTWRQTEKEVLNFNKKMASNKEWLKMGWYSLLGMLGSDNAYKKLFKQVFINYHKNYKLDELNYTETLSLIRAEPINKTIKNIVKYKLLEKIENPKFQILITYGENDIYGDSKMEVYNRYPTGQFKTISNSGHIPWIHNLNDFSKIISTFYFKPDSPLINAI